MTKIMSFAGDPYESLQTYDYGPFHASAKMRPGCELAFQIGVAMLAQEHAAGKRLMNGVRLRALVADALRSLGEAGILDVTVNHDDEEGVESYKPYVRHENPNAGKKTLANGGI